MDITDGEQALAKIKARLVSKKAISNKLLDNISRIRQNKLKMEENIEVQIAIRRGLVEIPTSGCLGDFIDAILVCRNVVEDINKILVVSDTKNLHKKTVCTFDYKNFIRKMVIGNWLQ